MNTAADKRTFAGLAWPSADFEQIQAIADTEGRLVDLWEASPVRIETNAPKTEEVVDAFFPGNPLLCCGWTVYRFDTRPRDR